jgi:predicted permease
MRQELVFGLKMLMKHKGFTVAAVLTLALCIGANTAIFSILQAVVLRDLPFPASDRLVTLYNIYPGVGVTDRGANAVPDFLDRRRLKDTFADVALMGSSGYDVGSPGSPQRIDGAYVTPSYFQLLQVRPQLGRTFTEEEAVEGKDKVAVLSHRMWKDMFAGDTSVLGKDIRLSGVPYRVVGVMPAEFGIPVDDARVWVPFAFSKEQTSDDARHSNNWGMIARLQPGVTIQQAKVRIDALNKENLDRFPKYRAIIESARFETVIVPLKEELTRDVRSLLYLLQIAVGVVLLIGCVNLANLMLVRSNVRMKESAIRFSLGAGRWRIGRQLLVESLALAAIGGGLGVLVGYAGVRALAALGASDLPRGASIGIDGSVLAFTAAVAILTGIAFGSVPLVHVLRRDLNEVFRGNERGGTAGHKAIWVRSALVVCQFALAFVLLIGSGLLVASFSRVLNSNPGFQPDKVMTARLSMPRVRYGDDAPARNFISSLVEKLQAISGVRHVALTTYLPFSDSLNASAIRIEGRALPPGETPPVPGWNTVNGSYFAALAIPVLQGRTFTDADGPGKESVAVIDQFLARKYWPNGDAVGAKVRRGVDMDEKSPVCTIIGVVGSVKTGDLAEQNPVGQIYFSYRQFVPRSVHLVLKTDRDDPNVASAIRREVVQADAELPVFDVKSMPERVAASLVNRRAVMVLCLIFAGLALLLAAVGIYGVLAYSVSQRTRELGIRVALGAGARDVLRMVVGQGVKLALIGLAAGTVAALALTRLMTSFLFGVRPSDPVVFVGVAAILACVALIASLIPSMRALRVRPATALRYE